MVEDNDSPPPREEEELEAKGVYEVEITEDTPWVQYEGLEFEADSTLTAAARKGLSKGSFADSENKAYPVHDAGHARSALQRFMQFGRRKYSGSKRKSVAGKILAAAKRFGITVSPEVRKRMMGDSTGSVTQAKGLSTRGLLRASVMYREEAKTLGIDAEEMEEYRAVKYELERRQPKQ